MVTIWIDHEDRPELERLLAQPLGALQDALEALDRLGEERGRLTEREATTYALTQHALMASLGRQRFRYTEPIPEYR